MWLKMRMSTEEMHFSRLMLYYSAKAKRCTNQKICTVYGKPPLTTPKADLHPNKIMLCVWWDWKVILYYELLENNETINTDKYCSQFDRLNVAIHKKRPELVNRKGTMITPDRIHLCRRAKNYWSSAGMLSFVHHIHLALHLQIVIYSSLYRIRLTAKTSIP